MKTALRPRRFKRTIFIPPPPLLVTFEARVVGRVLRLGKCVRVEGLKP